MGSDWWGGGGPSNTQSREEMGSVSPAQEKAPDPWRGETRALEELKVKPKELQPRSPVQYSGHRLRGPVREKGWEPGKSRPQQVHIGLKWPNTG